MRLKVVGQPTEVAGHLNMNERWLSVAEMAAYLGVNPEAIYKWINRKGMPGQKVGRVWKFTITEVDAWVRAGREGDGKRDKTHQEDGWG